MEFAHEKTEGMVVSRFPATIQAAEGCLHFGDATLPLREHVNVLGVEVKREMRFDRHLKNVAPQASLHISALLRVVGYLNAKGVIVIYKAKKRPYLEYAALTWMSSAPSHLRRLDVVEQRAMRLVQGRG